MARLCETAELLEQADFLKLRLANWVPNFCADVEKYAETAFYQAAAVLLRTFIACDGARMQRPADTPQSRTARS